MAVTANDLVRKVRGQSQDWGALCTSLETALTAADTDVALANMSETLVTDKVIQVDLELMRITEVGEDLKVERGVMGTTATTHASGAMVIYEPRFTNEAILDALNLAARLLAAYEPLVQVSGDGDYSISTDVEEYTAPAGAVSILKVDVEKPTAGLYRPFYGYTIRDEFDPPVIHIPNGTLTNGRKLRIVYGGFYPALEWDQTITISTKWHEYLVEYATGTVLENEDVSVTGSTAQASGVTPKPGQNQQIGRNLQARAMAHLEALRPATRIIRRPDQRQYRR